MIWSGDYEPLIQHQCLTSQMHF